MLITCDLILQPKISAGNWWLALIEKQIAHFLLFMGRSCPPLNALAARWTCWMYKDQTVNIDDGYRIFNIDCKVMLPNLVKSFNHESSLHRILNSQLNGLSRMIMQKHVSAK